MNRRDYLIMIPDKNLTLCSSGQSWPLVVATENQVFLVDPDARPPLGPATIQATDGDERELREICVLGIESDGWLHIEDLPGIDY
jgi:hypothetical protein